MRWLVGLTTLGALIVIDSQQAQAQCVPCTIVEEQWRAYTPQQQVPGPGPGCDDEVPPTMEGTDVYKNTTTCGGDMIASSVFSGRNCWPAIPEYPWALGGTGVDGAVEGLDNCATPACMNAYLNCSANNACDGVDTPGSQMDLGCGEGEHKCKERDSDDFPVRFSSGGRVEANPITVFDATPSNLPSGTFSFSIQYSSHYGREQATAAGSSSAAIRFEPYDTEFVGHGFLDNYSDRVLKRGASQYVWVRDRNIITFDSIGGGQFKSRGSKYLLVDQGGTTGRFAITSTSGGEARHRWTFDTFVYHPQGVTPAPEIYVLGSYKINVDAAGAGGYGWTVTRLADSRVDRVVDTLGREIRLIWNSPTNGGVVLFHRLVELKYAANASDVGTSVGTFEYFATNNLERIEFGVGRYARFLYDTSNIEHCGRCGHLLTNVIYPFAAGATPTLGAPLLATEVVTEGHEYEYYTGSDGLNRYRARKSFGPGRSWFYDWPMVDENPSVNQLDLHQPHATQTCGGCASGFACYPAAKGGDNKCYVAKTLALDTTNRNVTSTSGTFGGSYAYGPGQAPTRDTDSAGRKTTYGYSTAGDIRCIVRGDDDDQAFATPASPDTSACAGPVTAQIVRVDYTATTTTKTTPSLLSGNVTEVETLNSVLLPTTVTTTGKTRDIAGTVITQVKTNTKTYDALGRVIEENGPLTDTAFLDKTTISYYASFDASWPHNLGRVQSVTRYIGTTSSNTPITTTYSEYDLYGVPHRVSHPNSIQVTYVPSSDRLTWTITPTGAGVSTVKLNPDGTVLSMQDADGVCMTYEYSDASGYVGVPTKIRRSNTNCGVVPINVNSHEVEIRTYVNGERDRLQSVTRKLSGTTHFNYSGFIYDQDRRVTSASTINSATPFAFSFTDVIPSGTTAPGAPAAGTWRTDTTADDCSARHQCVVS